MAVIFMEIGQQVFFEGDFLEDAIQEGVRQGYREGFLRKIPPATFFPDYNSLTSVKSHCVL